MQAGKASHTGRGAGRSGRRLRNLGRRAEARQGRVLRARSQQAAASGPTNCFCWLPPCWWVQRAHQSGGDDDLPAAAAGRDGNPGATQRSVAAAQEAASGGGHIPAPTSGGAAMLVIAAQGSRWCAWPPVALLPRDCGGRRHLPPTLPVGLHQQRAPSGRLPRHVPLATPGGRPGRPRGAAQLLRALVALQAAGHGPGGGRHRPRALQGLSQH